MSNGQAYVSMNRRMCLNVYGTCLCVLMAECICLNVLLSKDGRMCLYVYFSVCFNGWACLCVINGRMCVLINMHICLYACVC